MNIEIIRKCLKAVKFSSHAKEEMLYEEYGVIHENEVKEAISSGEIIEAYPEDKPYPSCLIFGRTNIGRPLHIVCASISEEETLIIITVYQPDPVLWIDFKKRRVKK